MAVAVLGVSRVKVRVMPTPPPTPTPWLCLALMLPSVLLLCVWVLVEAQRVGQGGADVGTQCGSVGRSL